MSKFFEVDFRKGSFNDTMGRTVTVTGSPEIKRGEKGNYIASLNSSKYLNYSSQILPNNAFTLVVYIKHKYSTGTAPRDKIIAGSSSIAFHTRVSSDNNAYLLFATNNARSWNCNLTSGWHCLILTISGSAQTDILNAILYKNGVLQTVNATYSSDPPGARTSITSIGLSSDATSQMNIAYLATYDHVFTEAERNAALRDFNNSYPIVPEKYPQQGIINKPLSLTHLKDTGLVAAYNMIPQGNTLVDISGNGNNGTIVGTLESTKNGLKCRAGTDHVQFNTLLTGLTNWSISFRMKNNYPSYITTGGIIGYYTGGSYIRQTNIGLLLFIDGTLGDASGTITIPNFYNIGITHTITITCEPSNFIVYHNGIVVYNYTTNMGALATGFSRLFAYSSNYGKFVELQDVRFYNKNLSVQEAKDYHNSFVNTYLKCDFSDEGADGLAKVPSGWVKQSGSFKIGEWQPIITNSIVNGVFTTSTGWVPEAGISITDGVLRFLNAAPGQKATHSSTVSIGKKYKIKFTILNYVQGAIRIESTNITSLYSGNGTYEVELTTLQTSLFIRCGGTTTLDLDNLEAYEIPPLPTFKPGTKYLENVTAGVIALPSKQAYGTWEFDWYKGAGGNTNRCDIIANKPASSYYYNGYQIFAENHNAISFNRPNTTSATSACYTANSYITSNTWYRFKIIRSLSGVFTLLIKGGTFTPTAGYDGWTLISTTGGSGTNPVTDTTYTTSEYFVLDLDPGDRITNIIMKEGVEV